MRAKKPTDSSLANAPAPGLRLVPPGSSVSRSKVDLDAAANAAATGAAVGSVGVVQGGTPGLAVGMLAQGGKKRGGLVTAVSMEVPSAVTSTSSSSFGAPLAAALIVAIAIGVGAAALILPHL